MARGSKGKRPRPPSSDDDKDFSHLSGQSDSESNTSARPPAKKVKTTAKPKSGSVIKDTFLNRLVDSPAAGARASRSSSSTVTPDEARGEALRGMKGKSKAKTVAATRQGSTAPPKTVKYSSIVIMRKGMADVNAKKPKRRPRKGKQKATDDGEASDDSLPDPVPQPVDTVVPDPLAIRNFKRYGLAAIALDDGDDGFAVEENMGWPALDAFIESKLGQFYQHTRSSLVRNPNFDADTMDPRFKYLPRYFLATHHNGQVSTVPDAEFPTGEILVAYCSDTSKSGWPKHPLLLIPRIPIRNADLPLGEKCDSEVADDSDVDGPRLEPPPSTQPPPQPSTSSSEQKSEVERPESRKRTLEGPTTRSHHKRRRVTTVPNIQISDPSGSAANPLFVPGDDGNSENEVEVVSQSLSDPSPSPSRLPPSSPGPATYYGEEPVNDFDLADPYA